MLIGTTQIHYSQVTSTNDAAWAHIHRGAAEGTVITADLQTRGRGRRGRSWVAPPKQALLLSVILRPQTAAIRVPILTLLAGVAAARAIQVFTGLPARLKWPNDVWVREHKVGGILAETSAQGGMVAEAVLGIGINLNQEAEEFPAEWTSPAASLRMMLGQPVDREAIQKTLVGQLDLLYALFRRREDALLVAAWRQLDLTSGRWVWVQGPGQAWSGKALYVDIRGVLWVRSPEGQPLPIRAEEVSIHPFSSGGGEGRPLGVISSRS